MQISLGKALCTCWGFFFNFWRGKEGKSIENSAADFNEVILLQWVGGGTCWINAEVSWSLEEGSQSSSTGVL